MLVLQIQMNKLSKIGLIALSFTLIGCTDDINHVKEGFLPNISKSLTVSEAFDNYSYCTDQKWEKFETTRGEKIVRFSCYMPQSVDAFRALPIPTNQATVTKRKTWDNYKKIIELKDEDTAKKIFTREMASFDKNIQKKEKAIRDKEKFIEVRNYEFEKYHNDWEKTAKKVDEYKSIRNKLIANGDLQNNRSTNSMYSFDLRKHLEKMTRDQQRSIDNVKKEIRHLKIELSNLQKEKASLIKSVNTGTYLTFLDVKRAKLEKDLMDWMDSLKQNDPYYFLITAQLFTDFALSKQDDSFVVKNVWINFCWEDGKCSNSPRAINSVQLIYENYPLEFSRLELFKAHDKN